MVQKKTQLAQTNRTARLWVQLLDYIDTILLFIKAERLGDWEMHLTATHEMLNLFASTGHFHYAKSARFYLQQMLELPKDHPEIYTSFKDHGYHAIRRSERYWAGLWSDLVIEQVMMRSVKSRGGLTRGREFNESIRHLWVHTAHYCAVIHQSMSSVTKIVCKSSEQHEEFGKSRIYRDSTDLATIQNWFLKNNPFDECIREFKSLSTGVCDNGSVNFDDTEQIGKKIQEDLNGVCFHEVKIKRSLKVNNFESMYNSVKVDDKKVIKIKPTALFLRLIAIAQRTPSIEDYFHYELTAYPMSLFKDGLMRKPNKALLRNASRKPCFQRTYDELVTKLSNAKKMQIRKLLDVH